MRNAYNTLRHGLYRWKRGEGLMRMAFPGSMYLSMLFVLTCNIIYHHFTGNPRGILK